MKTQPKSKDVHVYFPPDVFAALKKLAKQNRRSMTAEVIIAIEEKVAKGKKQ